MGVIFIAGIHAVGKTTACTFAADSLRLAHYAASSLIKAEKASAISTYGKEVVDVEGNQQLLIRGVQKACERHEGRIILDGHFTLLKPDGGIETVAVDVFRALALDGVVVFQDEPAAIAERLSLRDGESRNSNVIAQHQAAEIHHAQSVSSKLDVPIEFLSAFDSDGLVAAIKRWF
jgi:adenylate kinase